MLRRLVVIYLAPLSLQVASFATLRQSSANSRLGTGKTYDYEYIPPNPDAVGDFPTNLQSAYDDDTPASLRGEAIRSALRSGRCVGWNLGQTPLELGVVKLTGGGTLTVLNGKVTSSVKNIGSFQTTCLLNSKGRMIDRLGVAMKDEQTAYAVTSPGHSAQLLQTYLDKFIFPLDDVAVEAVSDASIFSLASITASDVQTCYAEYMVPKLKDLAIILPEKLPASKNFHTVSMKDGSTLLILPTSGLPACSGEGFTFAFLDDAESNIGNNIWRYLVSDDCELGPICAGALEYDSLRIEAGQPAFGFEMRAYEETKDMVPAAPLELHYESLLDQEKGCYLGQEGVASMLKNPRGPPRILYQVLFEDELNLYDYQSKDGVTRHGTDGSNLTRLPKVGDSLFVLGSNEEISVGTITSVAQPSSTGDAWTLCLALVRRADSVLKQMKQRDIEMPPRKMGEDGIIYPPPLDPLDGLEIIIGGTYTIGRLAMAPERSRTRLYVDDVPDFVNSLPGEEQQNDIIDVTNRGEIKEPIDQDAELQQAIMEAEAAAAEAKRKEEKLKELKKRAEEAMARRKQRNGSE